MKAEKFKELFGVTPPRIMRSDNINASMTTDELKRFKDDEYCVILTESLYNKIIAEIERKSPKISLFSTKQIIELVKENEELKRGFGDMLLFIEKAKQGEKHLSIKNECHIIQFLYGALMDNFEAIRDHFKK